MSQSRLIKQSNNQAVLLRNPDRPTQRSLGERIRRFLRNENNKGLLFISPWFIGFILFGLMPLLTAVGNSFTTATLFKPGAWVGLQNYQQILTKDKTFADALSNMVRYLLLSIPLIISLSLFLAVLLSRRFPGNHLFRSIIYAPTLVVGAASGIMFKYVFGGGEVGLLNQFLGFVGVQSIDWVNDSNRLWLAMMGLVILNIWFVGGTMIIFLAAIKGISPDYYEAARIDGAGPTKLFLHITLPLIAPTLVFNSIMTLIGQMQLFDMPLIFATGAARGFSTGGSPLGIKNNLATFMTYMYYRGFVKFDIGYASAIALVVFGITFMLTVIVMYLSRRFTYYGEQESV
jgi:ABC-type sugar transport system permease subunit